jgi:hypothetical protein
MNFLCWKRLAHSMEIRLSGWLVFILVTASAATSLVAGPPIPTMGFAGILNIESVDTSDRKAVFVVSGECTLLLTKPMDLHGGNAQSVVCPLNSTVVVLYRRGADFPTDDAWNKECQRLASLVKKRAYFLTATPQYTFEGADLTLVSTDSLTIEARP